MARKILLADDSVTAQNMGRRILTDAGYEVITVNNGSAALKKIAELKPDLIVLDVYMPGYGGLEVCQRLKENGETTRIPVLLTVGKLEPFKAEEARRVRADGYVVKPFEASELLTALTKLEDKIVPKAEAYKPGRFAKAIAVVESEKGDRFGDAETGWKDRLKVPRAAPKQDPADDPEVAESRDSAPKERKSKKQKSGVEIEAPAVLPKDITVEELAAITAAAVAFESGAGNSPIAPETQPETPFAAQEAASVQAAEPARAPETSAADTANATFASAPQVSADISESKNITADSEVMAALASLAPANGDATDRSSAFASMDPYAASLDSGPRWIADPVSLSGDESTLILEREMEKARAAMADMEAAGASMASATVEVTTPAMVEENVSTDSQPVPAAEAPTLLSVPVSEERVDQDRTGEWKAPTAELEPEPQPLREEPIEAAVAEVKPAEAVSASEPEVAGKYVADAASADHQEIIPAVATAEPVAEPATEAGVAVATSEPAGAGSEPEAAFAAAAAAGSTEAVAAQPVQAVTEPETGIPMQAGDGRHRENELAAAWASWKQIRETVGTSLTTQVVDAAAAEIKDIPREQMPSRPQHDSPSASANPDAIASIVDSVLAQLKPRLVEEIARKMASDKKE